MLQILLMILKFLGIAVLVILGMILAVLLLVLLVPVRYRGDVAFDGKPKGGVLVSWLLHLVTVRVNYDGSVTALVKVLWFKLFDKTVWPAEETAAEVVGGQDDSLDWTVTETSSVDGTGVGGADGASVTSAVPVTPVVDPLDAEVKPVTDTAAEPVGADVDVTTVTNVGSAENSLQAESVASSNTVEVQTGAVSTGTVSGSVETKILSTGTQIQTEQMTTPESNLESNDVSGGTTVSDQAAQSNADTNTEPEPNVTADTQQTPVKEPIAEKIFNVIKTLVEKITCTYQQICGKVETGQAKLAQVRAFLADEANKNTIRLIKRQIFKLIKHVLPRKLTGRVKFGFDDPAATGQILMYVSPFYGAYAKSLKLEPVFDEKIMEGELHLKGHIRLGSILWIAIRVVLDKNFRRLLKLLLAKGKKKEETV